MTALLTSTDFPAGVVTQGVLGNLANDTAIDNASTKAWARMWEFLAARYQQPTTATGGAKEILMDLTLVQLYTADAVLYARTQEYVDRLEAKALERLKDARDGKNAISGLTPITSDQADAAGVGGYFTSNERVFTATTYRGA